jgi:hypothetical protein
MKRKNEVRSEAGKAAGVRLLFVGGRSSDCHVAPE